jgi:hypothetical protein
MSVDADPGRRRIENFEERSLLVPDSSVPDVIFPALSDYGWTKTEIQVK